MNCSTAESAQRGGGQGVRGSAQTSQHLPSAQLLRHTAMNCSTAESARRRGGGGVRELGDLPRPRSICRRLSSSDTPAMNCSTAESARRRGRVGEFKVWLHYAHKVRNFGRFVRDRVLRSLKKCSADREYTYSATLAQYAKTQSRTNASEIAHFVRIVCSDL